MVKITKNIQTVGGTIKPETGDGGVIYGQHELSSVSSATLTAITSTAPLEWHTELKSTWAAFERARERDLALLTRDPGPIRSHVAALTRQSPQLPDATLVAMADIVLKLRERRRERIWWIAGIIATAILMPVITLIVQQLT